MSRELLTWIEVKNEEGEWHTLKLFNNKGKDITDNFLFFNYAKEKLCTDRGLLDILRGFPPNCSNEIMELFKECGTEDDFYTFEAYERETTWYDWCELMALSRTPEAEEIDWEAAEEIEVDEFDNISLPRVNYVKEVVERISLLLEMNDIYSYNIVPGDVRIVCHLSLQTWG